jgi:predicted AAA+ superfamily ATPase
MIEWKLDKNKKPLVFLGSRQVGKTWLVKEFGKTEYRKMVYINFDDKDAPKNMFLQNFDIKRLITELELYTNQKITSDDILIVFDGIQSAPQGITSLKYFNENAPEYQIVAAGSLLGVNIHPGESSPVGKVNTLGLLIYFFC